MRFFFAAAKTGITMSDATSRISASGELCGLSPVVMLRMPSMVT